jgi:hypothetical protein
MKKPSPLKTGAGSWVRWLGLGLSVLAALGIARLTLSPSPTVSVDAPGPWCLFCGSRGIADAILNMVLFSPLGAGLALFFNSVVAVVASGVFSVALEIAQTELAGRFPTVGDIVFNTLGGGLGALLVIAAPTLPGLVRRPSRTATIGAILLPVAVFVTTPALLAPRYPDTDYFGQWKHELGHLVPYPGRVLSASVGTVPLPDERSRNSAALREALEAGDTIRTAFIAAEPVPEEAHLLAIYDHQQTGVFVITVLGRDIRYYWASRSTQLLLDQPFLQLDVGISDMPGERIDLEIWRERRTVCMRVDGVAHCALAQGVEGSWRLLYRAGFFPGNVRVLLSFLWVVLLCVPAGMLFPGDRRGRALLAVGLVGLALGVSWWSPFLNARVLTAVSPAAGLLVGMASADLIRRAVRSRA